MKGELLPGGLDFPSFPSLELARLITPIVFSQNSYLIYVLQVPLFHSTIYKLYKLKPFPIKQQENVYIKAMKDFIFIDVMRKKNGKVNYPELQACLMPNELTYTCKETIHIFTYIPNENCEATSIHPSTISLPNQVCEQRLLNLEHIYWIPLHLSNEWLYVAPKTEIFTVLCESMRFQLTLQNHGKLYLRPRCKGYSTHSTLYAISTFVQNNSQVILSLAPVDIDLFN